MKVLDIIKIWDYTDSVEITDIRGYILYMGDVVGLLSKQEFYSDILELKLSSAGVHRNCLILRTEKE